MSHRAMLLLPAVAWLGLAAAMVWYVPPAVVASWAGAQAVPAAWEVEGANGPLPDSQLVVTPSVLLARLPVGGQDEKNVVVGNHGDSTLVFTATVLPIAPEEGIVPWLYVWPTGGSVPPHGEVPLTATLDAAGEIPGLHLAGILVESDSPVAPPSVTVPVLLQIDELWYYRFLPVVTKIGFER